MIKTTLFILFSVVFNQLISQTNLTFEGQVIDENNEKPIALVKIKSSQTNQFYTTDLEGYFKIEFLKKTEANFIFFASNYDTLTLSFQIDTSLTKQIITLKKRRNILNQVDVVGDNYNGSINRLRAIEGVLISQGKKSEVIVLDKIQGNKAASLGRQVYSRIPGLNIWESDGAGIQLGIGGRGLSPTRTSNYNTRQNGYDISADALGYPESYYTPPTEAVQEIQLIRGAASLQFGTQFGGLLNFKMKAGPENKKLDIIARHTLGSFGLNSSFISFSGSTTSFNYYTYYQYKFGNDWRENSNFKVHSAGVYLYKYLNEKTKISLDFSKMYYLTQQPGGLTDIQFNTNPELSHRERNWFKVDWNLAALQFDYEFKNKGKLNSRFFGLIASRKALGFLGQINRVDPLEERDLISGHFKNYGNETRYLKIYNVNEMSWAYVVGFRAYVGHNKSEQGLASDGAGPDFNYLNPLNLESSSYEFPSKNLSVFAEHIFNVSKKLSFTPGFRFEHINTNAKGYYRQQSEDLAGNIIFDSTYLDSKTNSRSFTIFGIGALYKLNKSQEVYVNFSQNYRSINFTDMQIQNPNFKIDENLADEKGYNFDIGWRGKTKKYISFDASIFALYYHNRIGTTILTDSILYNTYQYRTNIASSITTGVEAVLEVKIWDWIKKDSSAFDLDLFVNTSYVYAKYINSKEAAYNGKNVELVPPINLKTGINISYKKFKSSILYSYTHQQYSDATNSSHQANAVNGIIPSYQVLDFTVAYTYKKYTIESGVNNMLNASYFTRRATGYPGPGIIPSSPRNYYLSVQIHL